jgi:type I restriction enzyme M protein
MFVQAEKFLAAHNMEGSDISVYGQELNERTWRMAKMNLAIHGLNANLASRWGDTFARDQHPELSGNNGADFHSNRPSTSDWAAPSDPAGSTAYRQRQLHLDQHHLQLAPGGSAGVGMALMSSNSGRRADHAQLVRADRSPAWCFLPSFSRPPIPVCTWFLPGQDRRQNGSLTHRAVSSSTPGTSATWWTVQGALSDGDMPRSFLHYHAGAGPLRQLSRVAYDGKPASATQQASPVKAADYALTPAGCRGSRCEDDGGRSTRR